MGAALPDAWVRLAQVDRLIRFRLRSRLNQTMSPCPHAQVDRLITELKLPPADAYHKLRHTIEEVNQLVSTYSGGDESLVVRLLAHAPAVFLRSCASGPECMVVMSGLRYAGEDICPVVCPYLPLAFMIGVSSYAVAAIGSSSMLLKWERVPV